MPQPKPKFCSGSEFRNSRYISQGSLTELKNQIITAKDIKYLGVISFQELMDQANVSHQILQDLITKSKIFLNHKS